MNDGAQPEQEELLSQLTAQAADGTPAAEREHFGAFIRAYYETVAPDILRARGVEELIRIARAHHALCQTRKPGQTRVRILPPHKPGGLAAVQTCTDDKPFLVDTLHLCIRNLGVPVDWTVHPILPVRRGRGGHYAGLDPAQGRAESLVHVEFEALADAAAYAQLEQQIQGVLEDLTQVVADFPAMRERLQTMASSLDRVPAGADAAEFLEAQAFLRWLDDSHFTFLGYTEAQVRSGPDARPHFVTDTGSALGLSRQGGRFADPEELIAPREEMDKYADSTRLVVVTKANHRSPLHHPDYMDVISVKRFATDGSVSGTCRFLGLFTTDTYTERPRHIPLIRRKAEYVMQRSRLPEHSHSGKSLRDTMHLLPRDELWQSSEEELYQTCMGIQSLRDRHQLKLFMRRDRYGRFYSCLVYLPRDRYSREVRDRIEQELVLICNGQSVERQVDFPRGPLARIHFIVRTPPGTRIAATPAEAEQRLLVATRSWREQLRELLLGSPLADAAARFADAFALAYTESQPPSEALADVQYLVQLGAQTPLLPRLAVESLDGSQPVCATCLKLYAWEKPVALSDVLPTLEHFGLRVIRQTPNEVRPAGGPVLWIQTFEIRSTASCELSPRAQKLHFEAAFLQTWRGETENDGLNRLVLAAGLDSRQVSALRMMTRFLIQTGLPYSQAYMEQLLAEHAPVARLLVQLFSARFDPALQPGQRDSQNIRLAQELDARLDAVASLDADRVLRAYLSVVRAGLRTNYFLGKSYISLKLDPRKVPELPQPLPLYEIFVYAPEVEGIHLRGGKVARGGLRWSDRPQDFRTEVLGLMKAQMVKNAVIVPVGAKGGFVLKRADASNREAWQKAGVEGYRIFLRGLLDLTDNRVGDDIVPPQGVVRHDDDDPYLVVAADKGTATFSDIANALAAEYGFWLGDAFASGGSAGYDHKKMGITARGAWESVKRHFREMGRNIQEQPFTVFGIGDMSGDVFGNGMLLSRQIRLIAAFDHRHIFLDPDPDPARSFAERERLFALPRSSWDDYDRSLISTGGGVYPRSAKSIRLSPQAREALQTAAETVTPTELMKIILRSPAELFWNGGIGTYVKATSQSHQDVGDRANDAIRINGRELRCKVVGEGGNLGFTQAGRIEYALLGGRINTDAIDNAGGVHSSDREVNIKIPLNQLMAEGKLERAQRDPLLARMTGDIVRFVLRDNEVQSAAISILEHRAAQRLDEHAHLISTLERDGLLNRVIECLPDEETLKERRREGRGLTRPELAVLLAYSKISLFAAMLNSDVPDDPYFEHDLLANFPPLLVEQFRPALVRHRLRREIIATLLTNAVVNRMGIAFSHRMAQDHGMARADIIRAYAAAHRIYGGDRYWQAIEALDNQVPAAMQYQLFERAAGLLKHATGWLLHPRMTRKTIGDNVTFFESGVAEVEGMIPGVLPPSYREEWARAADTLRADGIPDALAQQIASTRVLGSALDIVELAHARRVPLTEAATVYFETGERFCLPWIYAAINGLQVKGKWHALARGNLRGDAYRLQRMLAEHVLEHPGQTAAERLQAWAEPHQERVAFAENRLRELQNSDSVDFMGLVVAVRELRKLRKI